MIIDRQTDKQTNRVTFVLLEAADLQSPIKNLRCALNPVKHQVTKQFRQKYFHRRHSCGQNNLLYLSRAEVWKLFIPMSSFNLHVSCFIMEDDWGLC